MKQIKILGKLIEFEILEIGADYIKVDDVTYSGLTEMGWSTVECEGFDIIAERDKAIIAVGKSKDMPKRIEELENNNLDLMEIITQQYEEKLLLENKVVELEQQNIEIMLAVTEIYEGIL